MQFSEQWLRQYVNPGLDSHALGHVLTMAGLEVEAMESVAAAFTHVVIGQILSAEKHPDADRLQVCRVDTGATGLLQIVCGAPNARVGIKVPCALVGAQLPSDNPAGFSITQTKVRGVESFGMLCSAKELRLAEESSGLLELPAEAPVGEDVRQFLDLNDQLFTLKLTPNRSDCLSITGIAREVAAITGAILHMPDVKPLASDSQQQKRVHVADSAACPRYCGRLIQGLNTRVATPDWMLQRLTRSGLRSVSVVVDITNYVLLEMGQPLHAFDAATLQGDLHVRFAASHETLTLLNQQTVSLHDDMLVIADDQQTLALAGIMGGAYSAVSSTTVDIFLESAFFKPAAIAGRARRLGLSTDSSYRFERGVDFANTLVALTRATQLIQQICGGVAGPITERLGQLPERSPVILRLARLASVVGMTFDAAVVATLLDQLGFSYTQSDMGFTVTPPSYRFDVAIEEDLIEEIARLYGYDNIPATAPKAELLMLPATEAMLNRSWLRDSLVASGYQEVVNYSFVDERWEHDLVNNPDPIVLKNPIASNMSVMRSSLWGGLLDSLEYNLNRKQARVRLFELGAVYNKGMNGYLETSHIAGLAYGDALPEQWAEEARPVDFYDVKADVELLTHGQASFVAGAHSALHSGQSAQIMLGGKAIGWLGKLHPKWQQLYQLPGNTMLFELEAAALLARKLSQYQEVTKFPPVRRDMSVIVDESVPVQALLDAMQNAQLPLVNSVGLFDVYRGKGISENKKSLAFLVLMQDTQKTLTDMEADNVMAKLLDILSHKYGAILRN